MNTDKIITNVQWGLGILALGLYGGIEYAEGIQIVFNLIMTAMTMGTIWILSKLKEVIADEQKEGRTRFTNKVSKVQ